MKKLSTKQDCAGETALTPPSKSDSGYRRRKTLPCGCGTPLRSTPSCCHSFWSRLTKHVPPPAQLDRLARGRRSIHRSTRPRTVSVPGPRFAMAKKTPPLLIAVTLIVAVLSIAGFVYINSVIISRTVEFVLALDLASVSGLATGAGVLALLAYALYMINYPEGQMVSDAVGQRGRTHKAL